jgi:tripartite-type tricarboxylate transporter receptor subunit TctC
MNRRKVLHVLLATGSMLAAPRLRGQPSWPSRPVRVIVPFPPGATMESVVRLLGQEMTKALGQPVIVENKPGAGTVIGVEATARSTDGHTFASVANSFTVNHTLVNSLPYDTLRDLQPVGLMAKTANVLAAHPSVPAATLKDLVEYAKKNPGKLTYGSFGNGTTPHFAGEMLKMMAGIDMLHVPYKGQGPALADLIGGQVSLMFGNLPELLPQIRSGKLKAYGTTYLERTALAPEIPTIAEQGYAGFYTDSWYGIVAPASTPKQIVARMNAEINRALSLREVRDALAKRGLDPIPSTPERFGDFIRSEIAKYARIVKEAGLKID